MKFSTFSFIIAGAGLLQTNASPLRVVFVSHETSVGPQAGSNNETVAQIQVHPLKPHPLQTLNKEQGSSRHGCAGSRALSVSNALRQALGLPLIETDVVHPHREGGKIEGAVRFLPFAFGGPVLEHDDDDNENVGARVVYHKHHSHHQDEGLNTEEEEGGEEGRVHHSHHHHHHHDQPTSMEEGKGEEGPIHHHRHHMHHKFHGKGARIHHRSSFMRRLHFAIMTLGPWEGRTVAFVLGCGLGVLLRMLWVLTVVTYRTIRGDSSTQQSLYVAIPNQYDAEEVFVPPPVYVVDEKIPDQEEPSPSS
ncbi:hypothetical protein GGU10DRAFT_312075 [Lentinula aff. detonsa]|uniref:Uncharacterized protein n=1 Tax=Lentinula aff. detonsa TaxID=2804958 RepID=A0AA38KAD4_9AGAR|nr:hypothetical protein GGU10DRAFT_312075 [Lentinula aff. detonsa]